MTEDDQENRIKHRWREWVNKKNIARFKAKNLPPDILKILYLAFVLGTPIKR